ncbi:MAG: hypothetical protein U1F43_06030 [Myxococcota bacterium]
MLLLALPRCLGDSGSGPSVDSASHFLSGCATDDDCGGGLACVCSLCTVACSADDSCGEVAPDATCVAKAPSGSCYEAAVVADHCGFVCGVGAPCPGGLDCYLGECMRDPECPQGSTWDAALGYCATPWTSIPAFSGNQVCGPYYIIELPSGMNEFRPRADSSVSGGFLAAITTREQETLWSFSPNGETDVCNNLWGDVQGTWQTGIRRTAGLTADFCDAPITPPPIANFLRGCGIYSFAIEGRALLAPTR